MVASNPEWTQCLFAQIILQSHGQCFRNKIVNIIFTNMMHPHKSSYYREILLFFSVKLKAEKKLVAL